MKKQARDQVIRAAKRLHKLMCDPQSNPEDGEDAMNRLLEAVGNLPDLQDDFKSNDLPSQDPRYRN
jgi:hypothetical protein